MRCDIRVLRVWLAGLGVWFIVQALLLLSLDPVLQLFDHRVGPRYFETFRPFVMLLAPALLFIGFLVLVHRTITMKPLYEPRGGRWAPHLLLSGFVLVTLAPSHVSAWAVMFTVLWVAGSTALPPGPEGGEAKPTSRVLVQVVLGIVVLVGFVMRFANLAALGPAIDENLHLLGAIAPDFGVNFEYSRANFVTVLARLSFDVLSPDTFNRHLVAARLPGVLIGTATAVPVFLIGRRINVRVGLIAAAIWAVHPLSIAMSRYIREYVYFSFISTAMLAVGLGLVLRHRRSIERQLLVIGGAGVVLFRYASWDAASTFRANAILTVGILASAVLLIAYLDSAYRIRPVDFVIGGALLGAFGLIVGGMVGRDGSLDFSLGRPGLRMWQYYAGGMDLIVARPTFVVLVAGLLVLAFVSTDLAGRAVIFGLTTASVGMFLSIVNLWDRDPGVHYTSFLLPTMVLLLAIALDGGYRLVREVIGFLPAVGSQKVVLGLGAAVALLPFTVGVPNTDEVLRTLREPISRFVSHMDSRILISHVRTLPEPPQTTISTTSYQVTALLSGLDVGVYRAYQYNDSERHEKLFDAFGSHSSGLLALDRERGRWSLSVPEEDFSVATHGSGMLCVRYSGQFGDFHLWTWDSTTKTDCGDAVDLQGWLATSDRSSLLFAG